MSFVLFLLVNATLFIRPAEIVADLQSLPIYEWLIVSCLILSLGQIVAELQPARLVERPITLFVIGMLAAVAMSHLSHLNFYSARLCTTEFSKVALYYLLLVTNVNTAGRLHVFLLWLLGCIVIVGLLAVLQYHEVIDIPSLSILQDMDYDEETGERYAVPRLRSTGIFNDPNDLSMILVAGVLICAWRLLAGGTGLLAPLLLAAIGLCGYGLVLTKSRGGLLALGVGVFAVLHARYGLRRALFLAAMALPALPLVASGRQLDIGGALEQKTGQSRIQLWAEGIGLFRQNPLFGIGQNEYAEEVGLVAHNSFVHCFTELGFFGGTLFLAPFVFGIGALYHMQKVEYAINDHELRQLRPYVLAILAGYAVSMLSLSRAYVAPTYLVMGLAAVWLRLADVQSLLPDVCFDGRMAKRMATASVLFLVGTYVIIRVFARWSA